MRSHVLLMFFDRSVYSVAIDVPILYTVYMNNENDHISGPESENTPETSPESSNQPHNQHPIDEMHVDYPKLIQKFGVWPVNIGLFFFYSNVVGLVVLFIGLAIMYNTGVTDQQIISQKLGGLSVISSLITLGLTIIHSRKFYFFRH